MSFKVVIKQALRSSSFRKLVGSTDWGSLFPSTDYWTETQLFEVWNMLVGERGNWDDAERTSLIYEVIETGASYPFTFQTQVQYDLKGVVVILGD